MTPDFDLIPDAEGRLVLRRPDQPDVADVKLKRVFPWSEPDSFISVRTRDGKEVLLIEALNQLTGSVVQTIRGWLDRTHFTPVITRIRSIDVRFGFQQWSVETAAGPLEFRVQEREDIRFLSEGRFAVKDADGNQYEVPVTTWADPDSRKALSNFL